MIFAVLAVQHAIILYMSFFTFIILLIYSSSPPHVVRIKLIYARSKLC